MAGKADGAGKGGGGWCWVRFLHCVYLVAKDMHCQRWHGQSSQGQKGICIRGRLPEHMVRDKGIPSRDLGVIWRS